MNQYFYIVGAIAAGFCIALQAPANSKMRATLGDNVVMATVFSICGTFATALVTLLVVRPTIPSMADLRETQWWNWIGGPLGALFVFVGAALIKELGAALFVALVVAGQLACSLIVDHYGLMGLPKESLTPTRMLGAVLVVTGVVCLKYL